MFIINCQFFWRHSTYSSKLLFLSFSPFRQKVEMRNVHPEYKLRMNFRICNKEDILAPKSCPLLINKNPASLSRRTRSVTVEYGSPQDEHSVRFLAQYEQIFASGANWLSAANWRQVAREVSSIDDNVADYIYSFCLVSSLGIWNERSEQVSIEFAHRCLAD